MAAGSGADTIFLTADVTLTSIDNSDHYGPTGLPSITSEITLQGDDYTVTRDSSAPAFRIFWVTVSGGLTLTNTTVSNGYSQGGGGAGIFNDGGTVTLNYTTVSNGSVEWHSGGGIFNSGGTVNLTNSTLSGNSTHINSNGPTSAESSGGGIANAGGTVTLTNSTVSGNTVDVAAEYSIPGYYYAIAWGGGIINNGTMTLESSTVFGNSASATNNGLVVAISHGGAIHNSAGTLSLYNSTISGNSASAPHAADGGGISGGGTIVLRNSTLTSNSAPTGAAMSADATLYGSLVANSTGSANCSGTITDGDGNKADDTSCGTIPGDLTALAPGLADNGGPTMTHALLAGSNAIDGAGNCGLATDQRGAPRFDGTCDSGAFELGGCPLLELMDTTVARTKVYEECEIRVGPNFTVAGPDGDLSLTGGKQVVLANGFGVQTDGIVTIEIDPNLQVLTALEVAVSAGWEPPSP